MLFRSGAKRRGGRRTGVEERREKEDRRRKEGRVREESVISYGTEETLHLDLWTFLFGLFIVHECSPKRRHYTVPVPMSRHT